MRCIVTGGAGFIGSHLVEALVREGHEVAVLDNLSTGRRDHLEKISGVHLIECDLGAPGEWMNQFRNAEWVFHLAALADIVPSIQHPAAYFRSNVQGTFHVLQASMDWGVKRLVYAASSSCYGIPQQFPTSETAPLQPQYPYALTKRLGEEMVLRWAQVYKLPALSLRFFNVYGPRSRTSGTYGAVFGVFLAQKLAGQPFTVVGDGHQTRDFTFVTDVVSAIICAAKSSRIGDVYNVGSGQTVSINRITELLGGDRIHIPKRPGEPDCTHADIARIQKDLGWKPSVPIEQGISEMLKHLDYWRQAPIWTPASIAEATRDWFEFLGPAKA